MSSLIHETTDADFKRDVLESERPVLVFFWAAWAGPCNLIRTMVEDEARRRSNTLKAVALDVENHMQVPSDYGLKGLPTLILIDKGQEVGRKLGAISAASFEAWLAEKLPE